MPRIYDSNNDPINYCKKCFPKEGAAENLHRFEVNEKANDGRGDCYSYDCVHPPYEMENYKCHNCRKMLNRVDS